MSNEWMEHQKKIDRLRQIDRQEMFQRNLAALLEAVRSQRLSVEDVVMYTNITREKLEEILKREEF